MADDKIAYQIDEVLAAVYGGFLLHLTPPHGGWPCTVRKVLDVCNKFDLPLVLNPHITASRVLLSYRTLDDGIFSTVTSKTDPEVADPTFPEDPKNAVPNSVKSVQEYLTIMIYPSDTPRLYQAYIKTG